MKQMVKVISSFFFFLVNSFGQNLNKTVGSLFQIKQHEMCKKQHNIILQKGVFSNETGL